MDFKNKLLMNVTETDNEDLVENHIQSEILKQQQQQQLQQYQQQQHEQCEQQIMNNSPSKNPDYCINCINLAKNLLYLENMLKMNACKNTRLMCRTCQMAVQFLTHLNKNVAYVFSNMNYPQYYTVISNQNRMVGGGTKKKRRQFKSPPSKRISGCGGGSGGGGFSGNYRSTSGITHQNMFNYSTQHFQPNLSTISSKTNGRDSLKKRLRKIHNSKLDVTRPTISSIRKSIPRAFAQGMPKVLSRDFVNSVKPGSKKRIIKKSRTVKSYAPVSTQI